MATRSQAEANGGKSREDRVQQEGATQGNGTPDCIPFQLGDRACWAVRACGGGAIGPDGAVKPFNEIGHGRISGWLRVEDENWSFPNLLPRGFATILSRRGRSLPTLPTWLPIRPAKCPSRPVWQP